MKPAMACVLLLVMVGVSCSRKDDSSKISAAREPQAEMTSPFSGHTWLTWDKPSRVAFITGNIQGYWDGQAAGCGQAKLLVMSPSASVSLTEEAAEQMRFRCVNKFKLSNRSFDSYEQVITDFYSRYPDLRQIEVQDLLQMLMYDPQGKLTAKGLREQTRISR